MRFLSRLQTRLTVVMILILAFTVGASNWIITDRFSREYSDLLQTQVSFLAGQLLAQLNHGQAHGISPADQTELDEHAKELVYRNVAVEAAFVAKRNGMILFSSDDALKNTMLDRSSVRDAVLAGAEMTIDGAYLGIPALIAVTPYYDQSMGEPLGSVVVVVKKDLVTQDISRTLGFSAILTILFFSLSLLLIVAVLARWVTRPLGQLSRSMREVAAGKLDTSVVHGSDDEIGQLGRAFNEMVGQLRELLRQRTRAAELETRVRAEREQRKAAEKVHRLISGVSSTLDTVQVAGRMLTSLRSLIACDRAELWMLDEGKLQVVSVCGDFEPLSQDAAEALFRRMSTGEVSLHQPGQPSVVAVPVMIGGELNGIGILLRSAPFDEHEIGLALTFANQSAIFLENARMYEQMQLIAATDALTGLMNRRHFFSTAYEAIALADAANQDRAVLIFDIDHFKGINDRYGHPAGDRVLAAVASAARSVLAGYGQQLARYGGEEFCSLLTGMHLNGIQAGAEALRLAVEALRIPSDAGDIRVTISVGVACGREREPLEPLLLRADKALYRAKENGRNRVELEANPLQ